MAHTIKEFKEHYLPLLKQIYDEGEQVPIENLTNEDSLSDFLHHIEEARGHLAQIDLSKEQS